MRGCGHDHTFSLSGKYFCQSKDQTGFSAADALMIGDRCYDIDGARAVGTQALGVAYGYGSREELEKAGASKIAENVEDLRKLLL